MKGQRYVVEIIGVKGAIEAYHAMKCFENLVGGAQFPLPWYQKYYEEKNPAQRQFEAVDDGDAYLVFYNGKPLPDGFSFSGAGRDLERQSIMKKDAKIVMQVTEENKVLRNDLEPNNKRSKRSLLNIISFGKLSSN